jgi:aminopeptidase N
MVKSGKEQPLSTHADRFDINRCYSISSYSKGEIFLSQLIYLIGKDKLMQTLRRYYEDFKFKHPTPNDIKRTAERVSGANLDWYLTDWTQTTNTIDYGIATVAANDADATQTKVTLERIGRMPMPIDLLVEYTDGSKESFYIPLRMMSFEKENPTPEISRTVLADWAWAFQNYSFTLSKPKNSIKQITIDPSGLMADVKKENNTFAQ